MNKPPTTRAVNRRNKQSTTKQEQQGRETQDLAGNRANRTNRKRLRTERTEIDLTGIGKMRPTENKNSHAKTVTRELTWSGPPKIDRGRKMMRSRNSSHHCLV
ncbi:hypothetical protein A2U01_0025877 [Trifolium medium]|uniref:Uncharacterized protein n=1 Tax=Trifolium medium TaxID=97028 RepID=A0A392P082_9FABA|nr:hypothetical protein [Trifolium medium]